MDTEKIRADYERDGVAKMEQFYTAGEIGAIRDEIDRYIREVAPNVPESDRVLEADGRTVRNCWRMHEHSEFFLGLTRDKRVLTLAHDLVKGEPILMGVETFNKPARVGSAVPPHQDNAYFCLSPPDVFTLWIAIDPVTNENGPVFYVKGSHLWGSLPHVASKVPGNSMGLEEVLAPHEPFAGLLPSGGALAHHGQTIHYSAPNTSDYARCALLMVFKGAHCEADAALKEAYALGN